MGNINSRSKRTKKIPEFDQTESDQENHEKQLLEPYLPYDADSVDRLHIYHFLRRCIFQSNFSSPIEDKLIQGGCKVLDIGCGPGTWLLDLSSKYKNSCFFGIDIKPAFPQQIKPNNLEFIEADVTDRLSFHDNEFDFTHIESMGLMFTKDQWEFILSELIRVTKPGGYIEIADMRYGGYDGEGPIFSKLSNGVWSCCSKRNVDVKLIYNFDSTFESQPNIEKVCRIEKDFIVGPNGGNVGLAFQDLVITHFTSELEIKNLSNELEISEQEYKNLVENLTEEFKQTSPKCTHVRFWAQKQ